MEVFKKLSVRAIAALTVVSGGSEAMAQAKSQASTRLIEEVVVSARKRSESTQEISGSLTAHTADTLNSMGVSDMKDLQNVTPGLVMTEMASYSLIFIRGIGTDSFQGPIDSSVATYIDGMYVTYTSSQAQALGNVKSVTVMKGPQGTLYGRNAVGGAIVVESSDPNPTEYEANISYEVGNYDMTKGKAYFTGPIVDRLSFAISGLYHNQETYLTYTPDPSQKHKDYDDRGHRLTLDWNPLDWLSLQGNYYKIDHTSSDAVPLTNSEPAPGFEGVLTPNDTPWETGVGTEVFTEMETEFTSLKVELETPWFSTRGLFGHTEFFSNIFWDYDMSQEKLLIIEAVPNTAETDSMDITFTSQGDIWPVWFSWIAGYYKEDTFKDQRTPVYIDSVTLAEQLTGVPISSGSGPISSATGIPLGGGEEVNLVLYGGVQTDAEAMYAEFRFDFWDWMTITLGGRYSDETRTITEAWVDQRFQNLPPDGRSTEYERVFDYEPQTATWTDFTPSAGVDFQISDDKMVYLAYQTAFKSGNFNALNINTPPERVEPEQAETYEVGFKTDWLGGALRVNGAVFETTIEDGHVQILSFASGGVTRIDNASQYTVQGSELELVAYLTQNFRLTFGGTWLSSEYDDFVGTDFDPETGREAELDFTGNETVRAPNFTGTLDLNYEFPFFFGWRGQVGGGVYYNSGFWFNPGNNVKEDPYEKYNARFSFEHPEGRYKLYGFVSNINNAVSHMQKFRQDFGVGESYARPKMYGIGIEYNYF